MADNVLDSCDVLIVGAGPTGLTLACALAQRGVQFRIVEAAAAPPSGSRGKGLQPRSLELFDDLGVVDEMVAHGVFGLPIKNYEANGQEKVGDLYEQKKPRPDAPYVTSMITPQWRVEATLRGKLEQLGARVEFSKELREFTQDVDGVAAQFATAEGARTIRARWLVGCDGGRSAVRHLAELPFLGETVETYRMLVGDVRASSLDRDHWHIWRSAEGFLALCPLPSTESFQFQASIAPGQDGALSLDVFQTIVERRSNRNDIRVSDPTWMSLWRANVRMVDRYRVGRVFVAGDAAHVHSPAGGQGMNTGVQDAYNLGWKLAAVLRGGDAALLDTYQEERLPIAAWVIGVSNELLQSTVSSRTIAFSRDERTLQLGLNYRQSSLSLDQRPDSGGLRAGDRAPEAPGLRGPGGACRIFDLLRGPHATVLGFGARWSGVIDACASQFGAAAPGFVIVSEPGDPAHFVDAEGHARAAYGEDALYIVRPDNYIGFATLDPDAAKAIDYPKRICP